MGNPLNDGSIILKTGRFQFTIVPDDIIVLPLYKGSTFRGAFGHAFKRVICAIKQSDCSECLLKNKCIYSYVFETPPPPDTEMMRKYKTAPHPFVIEPPLEKRIGYNPGDEIKFGLTLIGKALDYLPYFIYAFTEMGKIGIGRGKGKFKLKDVSVDGNIIYDSEGKTIKTVGPKEIHLSFLSESSSPDPELLTLNFLTPTRIVYNTSLTLDLDFHMLIRQLLRRLSLIYYFHCDGDPSAWDFKGIIEKAEAVRVITRELKWYDWERYSARQDTRMKMGGFVGKIIFEGDIVPFISLIKAGEVLHVGKGTSFGLGMYEVK